MKVRAAQREICARLANFRAIDHQPKVGGLGVRTASFEAMIHRHLQTRFVTGETAFDAGLHRFSEGGSFHLHVLS